MADHDAYRLILGRNISGARGRLQFSQTAVAERMVNLGFSDWRQQTLANVEKGKRRLTAEELIGLAEALETTLAALVGVVGGELFVELPSESGRYLPGAEILHLASGGKGGASMIAWHKNAPVQAVVSPRELQGVSWSIPATKESELPPVVAAIVTSRLGVLVGRRNDGKPPWTFIAGEQEPGERIEDTAIREVKEETGLRIEAGERIGERVHPKTGRTMVYMAATPTHGTHVIVGDEDELAEVRWVSLAEADELLPGMFEPVREHLARVLGESLCQRAPRRASAAAAATRTAGC
jgi:8-oxo-dGTP diphosphatase